MNKSVSLLTAIFFTAFGLTLFGVPFATLIAQVSALILGIIYIIQLVKSS